ncbi:hypothetical protein N7537_007025 [Penicillium hordei]|uniref:Uncharacterized protein n=1 Tax=Penicillium hordei TaxID=40994 RepID=A0AAD6E9Y3_9EURO|nr:uncharacterized protein N7537_007025 [Penicillium hordei]KAJ5604069.1 hypothetical protein N7537_007025 [Penicillium hordei]
MEALESSGFRAESQRPRDITEEYDEFSGSPTLVLSLIATGSDEPDAVNVGPDEGTSFVGNIRRMSELPVVTLDLGSVSGFVNSSVAKSVGTVGDGCSDDMTMPSSAAKPAAGVGTVSTIPNTPILSMHIDPPPTILIMRWGVATTHRGNIPKNDETEDFYEPQALSRIRGLLAVVPDRGDEDGSTSPDGNAGGDDDDTGWSGGAIQGR